MSRSTAIITISASFAGAALAERPALQVIGPAGRVEPIAVGKVAIVDGQLQVVSPMYPYRPSPTRSGWTFLWDSCEFDDPNPNFGVAVGWSSFVDCAEPCYEGDGSRFFFGIEFHNPFVSSDMSDIGVPSPVAPPGPYKTPTQPYLANGLYFTWFWYVGGAGTSEQCTIIILPSDTYTDCTSSNPDDGFLSGTLSGVILDFGVLESGALTGYYYTGVDLSATPITMDLTTATGYSIVLSQTPGADGPPFYCASGAQCALWGTGEDELTRDCRTGTQNERQYDDDSYSPVDCMHDPRNECAWYTFGTCPSALGPALGFVTNIFTDPCACAGDFDGDHAVTLGDLSAILSGFGGLASNACMDFDADGVISISDLAEFLAHYGDLC